MLCQHSTTDHFFWFLVCSVLDFSILVTFTSHMFHMLLLLTNIVSAPTSQLAPEHINRMASQLLTERVIVSGKILLSALPLVHWPSKAKLVSLRTGPSQ